MQNHQKEILTMLKDGKIDVEEAQKLLGALETGESINSKSPQFFHILAQGKSDKEKMNIKVPLKLLRSGIKWMNFIPGNAIEKVQKKLQNKGINFDLRDLNAENIEDLLDAIKDLEVSAGSEEEESVRIFCS